MIDIKTLTNCIEQYGFDIKQWPENIRTMGLEAYLNNAEFRQLIDEEHMLQSELNARMVPEARPDLASRIIQQAARISQAHHQQNWYQSFKQVLPEWNVFNPNYALGLSLVIGLVVGIGIDNTVQAQLTDDFELTELITEYWEEE